MNSTQRMINRLLNAIPMDAFLELQRSLFLFSVQKTSYSDKNSAENYFRNKISSFKDEMKTNVATMLTKENGQEHIDRYFEILNDALRIVTLDYEKDSPSFRGLKEVNPEADSLILLKRNYINVTMSEIIQVKADMMVRGAELAKKIEEKAKNTFTIVERIILILLLQKNKHFEEESQETKQVDLLKYLSLILGVGVGSVKPAYQKSRKYLVGNSLTKPQMHFALRSLRTVLVELKFTKNRRLISVVESRIRELELLCK